MSFFSKWTEADVAAFNARYPKVRVGENRICGIDEDGMLGRVNQPESVLHDQVWTECRRRGWIALHGAMSEATHRTLGEPDFTILADSGRVFFIECKTAKGKLSGHQLALKAWAAKLGHTVHVVRSMAEFLQIVG